MSSGKVAKQVNPLVVRPGMKIGNAAAEADDEFLFECFIEHPAVQSCKNVHSSGMILAGRTGSGKTAITRYIERSSEFTAEVDPSDMSLSYVSNSDSLRFVQAIGGNLDLLFLALWKHVLCIEYIRLKYKIVDETRSRSVFQRLTERFQQDARKKKALTYLKDWEGKFWITMDQNIKEITEKYESKLAAEMGGEINKFKAGGQYEKRLSTDKKSELVARARKIINADQLSDLAGLIDILSVSDDDPYGKTAYILIDKLDDHWVDVSIRFKLIRALIEALRAFRRIPNLKILVALRSDILERVVQETGDLTFQREKLEDFFIRLKWSRLYLAEFVDRRIGLLFRRQYSGSSNVRFSDVFSHKVGGADPFDYIVERTLMRPRDVLSFVNTCLEQAEGQTVITAKLIRAAEGEYSRIRRQALEEEWLSAFPSLPRLLDHLRSFRRAVIDFSDLCEKEPVAELALPFTEARVDYDPLHEEANKLFGVQGDSESFMKVAAGILYRVGAVGLKPNPGERFYYSHIDVPVFNVASLSGQSRVRIHPMLHRALGIEPRGES